MKIMIGVGHPKHVHIWKNIIKILIDHGHEVKIVAREKDITLDLLDIYNLNYLKVGKNYNGIKKIYGILETDIRLYKIVKLFNPDILLMGTPYLAQISKLFHKSHITLLDTEHANLAYWLSYPFTNMVLTPSSFKGKINKKKHVIFNGYFELAYLHPNYFKPDPEVLEELNLYPDDKFIIMRFSAWNAHHDMGDSGFLDKIKAVKSLEKVCKIFISSEIELPEKLKKYKLTVSPEKIHHLLYYANLFIGESAPMSTESAILGTPAIFVSSSRRGYTDELEFKYDMVYTFSNKYEAQEKALEKAKELLAQDDIKKKWQTKQERLLSEKIDVTKFMIDLIESYPEKLKMI